MKTFTENLYAALTAASKSARTYQDKLIAEAEMNSNREQEFLLNKESNEKTLELKVTELISNPEFFNFFETYNKAVSRDITNSRPIKLGKCSVFHYGYPEHGSAQWNNSAYGVIILEKALAMYLDNQKVDCGDQSTKHKELSAKEFVTGVSLPVRERNTQLIGLTPEQLERDLFNILQKSDSEINERLKIPATNS